MTSWVKRPDTQVRETLPDLSSYDHRIFDSYLGADFLRPSLCGRSIFITGGTGYVGRWIVEALLYCDERLRLGLKITLLSRDPLKFKKRAPALANRVSWIQGDCEDLSRVDGMYDVIVHAAADVAHPEKDPVRLFHSIVKATEEVLSLSTRCGVQRMLYLSSGAVYGAQSSDVTLVSELERSGPDLSSGAAAYGHAKRISEWLINMHATKLGFSASSARLYALLGAFLPLGGSFAAGSFLDASLRGQDIVLTGPTHATRSYIYGADMAVWLIRMLAHEHFLPTAFNVGSDREISILDFAHLIAEQTKTDSMVISSGGQGGFRTRYVPDTSKAATELHLEIYTDLSTALTETIGWCRRAFPDIYRFQS